MTHEGNSNTTAGARVRTVLKVVDHLLRLIAVAGAHLLLLALLGLVFPDRHAARITVELVLLGAFAVVYVHGVVEMIVNLAPKSASWLRRSPNLVHADSHGHGNDELGSE